MVLIMHEACINSWYPYDCEWSVGYLWRWMNWYGRLDVIVLALMLAYVVVIFARVSYRYHLIRRSQGIDGPGRSRRALAADLSIEVANLKSIASTAPYLGLAGTCLGILGAFKGSAVEKHTGMLMIVTTIGAAFVTTAAGMPVAVPATCSYNYLRTRIDFLESEILTDEIDQRGRHFRVARRLPLTKRFSELPAFALIAAPGLAMLMAGYMTFASFHPPTGLGLELASACRECDGNDRLIVLYITDTGKLLLNQEQQDWQGLGGRLSEIYRLRAHRTLYLLADEGVSFQTLADVLDIVENAPVAVGSKAAGIGTDKLDIRVRLVTPGALNGSCPDPRRDWTRML